MSKPKKPKRSKKSSKKKASPRSGISGSKVRRKDKNSNTYFIDRNTGKRVSEKEWKLERKKLQMQRDLARTDREKELSKIKHPPKQHFPGYVDEVGVPQKKRDKSKHDFTYDASYFEGEAFEVDDFEPFAIEGEDETG